MGSKRRFHFNQDGTRFRLFAHSRGLGFTAERVFVDVAPGSIRPGPADDDIDVIDALDKPSYYSDVTGALRKRPAYPFPPDGRRALAPVPPRDSHFDHLMPPAWAFSAAAVYAAIRTTLSVWSHFFDVPRIDWHFAAEAGPILQVHPRTLCANGWSGNGFLEFGFPHFPDRRNRFCDNLEVVAHETGHLIMKSMVGTMPDDEKTLQHRAHEEGAADLIALVTGLHFETVIAHVLKQTGGYLYGDNLLSRFGEWGRGPTALPRRSFNDATLPGVRAAAPVTKHALSAPFTGAVYDVFVEIFLRHLLAARVIDAALAERCRHQPGVRVPDLRAAFKRAHRAHADEFAEALRLARDDLGWLLASGWRRARGEVVSYQRILRHLLAADAQLGTGAEPLLREAFAVRGIVA